MKLVSCLAVIGTLIGGIVLSMLIARFIHQQIRSNAYIVQYF